MDPRGNGLAYRPRDPDFEDGCALELQIRSTFQNQITAGENERQTRREPSTGKRLHFTESDAPRAVQHPAYRIIGV